MPALVWPHWNERAQVLPSVAKVRIPVNQDHQAAFVVKNAPHVRHVAVLLVEQKIEAALKVADRIAFLENGSIRGEATPDDLAVDPQPLHRYVGVKR